jgi:1-acyl-sn-glycerol-3-phosphate acyltransferase
MIYEFFRMLGMILGYPLQLVFFKRRTYFEGKRNRSFKRGGKLIITNHFNMFDYVLTTFVVYPRKLNVVASEMPFTNKFFRFGMKFFGAIQANRVTKNMKFMDECAHVITAKKQLVQIYPEARNTPDGKIHEFKHSYLVIAHRAGAPIVPIITDGNYGLFKRASVIIGEEIDIKKLITSDARTPSRDELNYANDYVFSKVLELRERLEELKSSKKGNQSNDGIYNSSRIFMDGNRACHLRYPYDSDHLYRGILLRL